MLYSFSYLNACVMRSSQIQMLTWRDLDRFWMERWRWKFEPINRKISAGALVRQEIDLLDRVLNWRTFEQNLHRTKIDLNISYIPENPTIRSHAELAKISQDRHGNFERAPRTGIHVCRTETAPQKWILDQASLKRKEEHRVQQVTFVEKTRDDKSKT